MDQINQSPPEHVPGPLGFKLYELGYSISDVMRFTGLSQADVKAEIDTYTQREEVVKIKGKENKYKARLQTFAQLSYTYEEDFQYVLDNKRATQNYLLWMILWHELEMQEVVDLGRHAQTVVEFMHTPSFDTRFDHEAELLGVIFRIKVKAGLQDNQPEFHVNRHIKMIFREISFGGAEYTSNISLRKELLRRITAEKRLAIMPHWDDLIFDVMDKTMRHRLEDVAYHVLCMRFGLTESRKQMTRKEISEELGISVGQVHRYESSALRKLRHSDGFSETFRTAIGVHPELKISSLKSEL